MAEFAHLTSPLPAALSCPWVEDKASVVGRERHVDLSISCGPHDHVVLSTWTKPPTYIASGRKTNGFNSWGRMNIQFHKRGSKLELRW
jgi:hypothetical protein